MKILICCNVYPPNFIGGAELIAHQQALALTKLGHEVQIFTGDTQVAGERYSYHEELYENLKVHRIRLINIDYDPNYICFSHQEVEKHFIQLSRKFCPDIIHFHNIIGLSVTILRIAKELNIKTILTLHDYWGFCLKNTMMKREKITCGDYSRCEECQSVINDGMNRRIPIRLRQNYFKLMIDQVDFFISPSQFLAEMYLAAGINKERMTIIWNGIDFDYFDAIKKKSHNNIVRFSFFGYFGRHKGVATLIDALLYLKNQHCVQINLIGDGDEKLSYIDQLNKNNCANLVKFWGKLDNNQVYKAYAETDVLVLPSIWRENQPVSITEAMTAGIPPIVSNMGGMPEMVEDGKTGLIFEAGSSQDLAEKMDFLIDHPELRQTYGRAAKEKMRNNTFENQARKLLALYKSDPPTYYKNINSCTLILCVGHCFDSKCSTALKLLPYYLDYNSSPLLVMADWVTEQQYKQATLIWIVDPKISINDIQKFFWLELPFLVPEENKNLVNLCCVGKFGLYYNDEHEAAACIRYFLREKIK